MRTLERTLQDLDLGHLRIIAELWGLDLPPGRAPEVAPLLARAMLEQGLALEMAQALPPNSRQALEVLLAAGGRAPLGELSLRFGPLRPVGPGRRDREHTWRDPQAALDGLRYRAFMGTGFSDTPSGPQEFGFVPDELRQALAELTPTEPAPLVPSPVPPIVHPAGGAADDAVTLLAGLRRRPSRSHGDAARPDMLAPAVAAALQRHLIHPESLDLLVALLRGLGVLQPGPLRPDPARVRELLASGRQEVERRLLEAWSPTRRFNDLAHTPRLAAPKGKWPNDPAATRAAVLSRLASLEVESWFDLESFIADTLRQHPAFLRPGGDFDSWLLQDAATGRLLAGVAEWYSVEGAFLRHIVAGPLHWLGAADLGQADPSLRPSHFRLRFDPASGPPRAPSIASGDEPPARISPDGRVAFPPLSSLPHRYQVARFAEWVGRDATGYRYRLSPRALTAAAAQGLEARRVEVLLETASRRGVPEVLRAAIARWGKHGTEAILEVSLVLRVKDAEVLRRLRADPATGRYLQELLGPTAARVRSRDRESLLAAAARLGLLIQIGDE